MNWLNEELQPEYLSDSGLLFEINRSYMHPLGLAITIIKSNNKSVLNVRDDRKTPDRFFDDETFLKCNNKLRTFMVSFGHSQINKRTNKFGWYSQCWNNVERKRTPKIKCPTFWTDRVADAYFLADSAMLFEINRNILHPVGIALAATEIENKPMLILKDNRKEPYTIYSKEKLIKGIRKLENFMSNFGRNQLSYRRKLIGYSTQTWRTIEERCV